ncbi:uncharacterized protein LOC131651518 [Vicia villosa]|uniref:uncharacterized protein LOC131651518 n=1 Tax=Vicia villosa TaxID=3911 RepID=UPI00273B115A|nr:uncharacterized protein LOC131651518 [Vicia villosa]
MVMAAASSSSSNVYLPDECWECIFKFLINHDTERAHRRYFHLKPLSIVSKQLLSITNRFLSSLTIYNPTCQFFHTLFRRFSNITSLNLSSYDGDLDYPLVQISRFPLKITSLDISNHSGIPAKGLRAFSKNITTLTSLVCSNIANIYDRDMLFIEDGFPLLEELDISITRFKLFRTPFSLALSKLRKVNLYDNYYMSNEILFHLFKNCKLLEEVNIVKCWGITLSGIAAALRERPTLTCINISYCKRLTESSLFKLVSNCPSLTEIKMEWTSFGKESATNSNSSMDCIVNSQVKSLYLAYCARLRDETIIRFSSLFSNLQLLDMNSCQFISDEGIDQVLSRFLTVRHLNLANCSRAKLLVGTSFELPNLEVLNLSYTTVDDKTLYAISKGCRGLLQLYLENCGYVTWKGVKYVFENCTQLREINLRNCYNVRGNICSMLSSSQSLRKLIAPPHFRLTRRTVKLLSHYGCRVC